MSDEKNGWGTFSTTTSGIDLDVIDFTPPELIADDEIDTTTNKNGNASGGVRSFEPSQFYAVGNTTFTVSLDYAVMADVQAVLNVKDTGTLTSKSGATIPAEGWFKSYTPDTSSPTERPTATVVWVNFTGEDGENPPTPVTP